MKKIKAVVKFVDGAGRLVALTETHEAALITVENFDSFMIGQTIELERVGEQGKNRRVTDWSLVK